MLSIFNMFLSNQVESLSTRKQVNKVFKFIEDNIVKFTDYFAVQRRITLSEVLMFVLVLTRGLWFTIFGVRLDGIDSTFAHHAWAVALVTLAMCHVVAAFSNDLRWRIGILMGYALIWLSLAAILVLTDFGSPALPTFIVFAVGSVFVLVRLNDEWRAVKLKLEIEAGLTNAK